MFNPFTLVPQTRLKSILFVIHRSHAHTTPERKPTPLERTPLNSELVGQHESILVVCSDHTVDWRCNTIVVRSQAYWNDSARFCAYVCATEAQCLMLRGLEMGYMWR